VDRAGSTSATATGFDSTGGGGCQPRSDIRGPRRGRRRSRVSGRHVDFGATYSWHKAPGATALRWMDACGCPQRGHAPRAAEPFRRRNRHSGQRHCPERVELSAKPEKETLQLLDSIAALAELYGCAG